MYINSYQVDCLYCLYLVPSPPKSVNIIDVTTVKLTIEIVHGEGRADSFDVLLNQLFHSNVVVNKNSSATLTEINGLDPGTLYRHFTVLAVSNGINSSQTPVPVSSTSKFYLIVYLLHCFKSNSMCFIHEISTIVLGEADINRYYQRTTQLLLP